jgi:hypothetical protein
MAPEPTTAASSSARPEPPSRLGHFIQTYSSFLSSFVIGVAGLVATSIWQYRQSQTAARQAESEQAIARTKAENDWRIARAEILAKNLNILASQGPDTADQRFGVLLSLTRGSILDPELAVSYALELGKVNSDYMRSVLASTEHKNYLQLEHAFALTCLQKFGVEKAAEICRDDRLADRSDAIAQVIEDEIDASAQMGPPAGAQAGSQAGAAPVGAQVGAQVGGPLSLLRDEREIQARPAKLMWLFEPYLQDRYERRQWNEINAFENSSDGAKVISALVLATARTGELVTNVEQSDLDKFHAQRRKWLAAYLLGRACDPECRGKIVDVMLSTYGEAQGDYDDALQRLVQLSRAESGPAISQLHARLLWCQVDNDDLQSFRDRVLVPAAARALSTPGADRNMVEDLVGLVALVPEPKVESQKSDASGGGGVAAGNAGAPPTAAGKPIPTPATLPPNVAAWKALLGTIDKAGDKLARSFASRRATVKRERANPPPMIKRVSFCGAAEAPDRSAGDTTP